MTLDATGTATPIGPLSIIVHRDVVVAAGFTDDLEALHHRLPEPQRIAAVRRHNRIGPITDAVQAYLAGVPGAFDALPVAQPGGVPAGRMGGAAQRTGRRDRHLHRAGRSRGAACDRARRRDGLCPQPRGADGALPPGHPPGRLTRWLLLGVAGQTVAAHARNAAVIRSPRVGRRPR